MKEGQALINTPERHDDFGGDVGHDGSTVTMTGPPKLISCWKCPKCGRSLTRSNEALSEPDGRKKTL